MLNQKLSICFESEKSIIKILILKMDITLNKETSLGLETYDKLGFNSKEELELEISKLIKIRPEFEKNLMVANINPSN